jgi:REP element-mobilizing transposase RayT
VTLAGSRSLKELDTVDAFDLNANPQASFHYSEENVMIVAAHHLIWTVYGWWLPNDPRGSSSHEVRVPALAELGPLHYGRKVVQPSSAEQRAFHAEAQERMQHPVLLLDDALIEIVSNCFRKVIQNRRYTCYACAILPNHVHLVIRKHRDHGEDMIDNFQNESRAALIKVGARTNQHPVWGGPGWKVFLFTQEEIVGRIEYVRNNPIKEGRPKQLWDFVQPYDGWLAGGTLKKRRASNT